MAARLGRYALASGLLLLPCLAFGAATSGAARAADSLYDVAKISVDITAENAVAAREMGMAEAEARAVKTVLQRLLPVGVDAELPGLTKEDIEGLVSGVSIRKEQNSTTRYIAILDVSVNEEAIKQLLQEYRLPYGEERAEPVSILPLMIAGDAVADEGEEGWRQAFDDLDLSHSITPATILRPRPDLAIDTVKAVLAGDAEALAKMQDEYGSPARHRRGRDRGRRVRDAACRHRWRRRAPVRAERSAWGTIPKRAPARPPRSRSGRSRAAGKQPGPALSLRRGRKRITRRGPARRRMPQGRGRHKAMSRATSWPKSSSRASRNGRTSAGGSRTSPESGRSRSIRCRRAGQPLPSTMPGRLGRLQQELDQNGFVFDEREGIFVLRSR